VATLGATGTDDGTATTGAHADEKAVGALATHDGRLIGTLHDRIPCEKSARLQLVRPVSVKHYFAVL
jgi:hypothetical protein